MSHDLFVGGNFKIHSFVLLDFVMDDREKKVSLFVEGDKHLVNIV